MEDDAVRQITKSEFLALVGKHRRDVGALIGCAEKLCERLPRFREIDASRSRAYDELSGQPPDSILDNEKRRAWRAGKKENCDAAQAQYTKTWNSINKFQDRIRHKLEDLRQQHFEAGSGAVKILSDSESDSLKSELSLSDGTGLGSSLPSTLRALSTLAHLLDDTLQQRTSPGSVRQSRGRNNPEDLLSAAYEVTVPTAAKYLDVTQDHLRRLIRRGKIKGTNTRPKKVTSESLRAYRG